MKSYSSIDYAKLFFAMAIVTLHVSQENIVLNVFAQYIARVGVPFFLTVSGFFLYKKLKSEEEGDIIKRYLLRLAKLFGVWMLIYSPFLIIRPILACHGSLIGMIKLLQEIVFKSPAYLWYLVALMVSCILLFFFRKHLKIFLIVSIGLFIIGACGNTYIHLFGFEKYWEGYFRIFLTTRNGIFFAPIFVCLGAVLSEYEDKIDKLSHQYVITAVTVALYLLEVTLVGNSGKAYEDRSFYFILPLVTICLVNVLRKASRKSEWALHCRKLSTWVYCSQFGFLTLWSIVFGKLLGGTAPGWILWMLTILAGTVVYLVLISFKFGRKVLKVLI